MASVSISSSVSKKPGRFLGIHFLVGYRAIEPLAFGQRAQARTRSVCQRSMGGRSTGEDKGPNATEFTIRSSMPGSLKQ